MGLVVNKQQPFCFSQRKYSHQYFLDAHCPPTIYQDLLFNRNLLGLTRNNISFKAKWYTTAMSNWATYVNRGGPALSWPFLLSECKYFKPHSWPRRLPAFMISTQTIMLDFVSVHYGWNHQVSSCHHLHHFACSSIIFMTRSSISSEYPGI